ncbi:MAG: hypothetical protein U1F34_08765 [Gammaproteobacteria bacterium]
MKHRKNDIVSLQSRRDFLKQSIWLGLLAGTGTLFDSRSAYAAGNQVVNNKVLAEIFLGGGPDLRHGFPPPFSATAGSVGNAYWKNKATAYDDGTGLATDNATLQAYYNANFTTVSSNGASVGILNKCDWLIQQFNAGHVALISNVFGSESRDHDHATKVMDYGDTTIPKNYTGSGWGGRLAYKAGGNSLAISGYPRAFSFGPDPAAPTVLTKFSDQNVIITSNMRDYGLYDVDPGISSVSTEQRVARDLRLYYAEKRKSISAGSAYARFFDAEKKIRDFGNQIAERLLSFPEPADLKSWIETTDYGYYLGLQMRNLHDALACSDIINLRASRHWSSMAGTHTTTRRTKWSPNFRRCLELDRLWISCIGTFPPARRTTWCLCLAVSLAAKSAVMMAAELIMGWATWSS